MMKKLLFFFIMLLSVVGLGQQTMVIETTSTLSSWTPNRITNSGATLRWEVTGGVTIPEQTVNLPTFDLSGNTGTAIITATSDDGFVGLTEVDVRGLDITAMDVTNAAALTRLIAFGNDMTSIDLSNNVNLVQVRLQTNNLSTLDLTGLDALTSLDAFSNGMSSITLPNSSSLETVNINNNGLSVLDVSGNSGLLFLFVTDNLLPTSELDNLVNTLDSFNTSDGVLNISGNTGALSSASDASYANLESRNWTIDAPAAVPATIIVIETTSTLSSWTPNRITNSGATLRWEVTGGVTIPEQTVNLPTFDLSGNTGTAIITATSDDGFVGLTEVDVRGLDITAMDVTNAAALTRLIAFGNDMTSIDLSNNVNLVQVRLQTNNLSTLDLTGLDALTSLDAFSNGMSLITLPNSSSLETVNINNNGLSVLDVSGNSGLLTLSVTGNLLPTSELDNLVNTLDSFNTSDGVLNISGNTGALSSASAASYANLESRNWTIDIPPATAGTTIVIETTSTLSSWTPSRITNSGATLRWEVTGGVTIPEQTVNLPTFDLSGNTGTAIITATSDDGFAGLTEVDVRGLDITAMDVTNAAALTRLIAFGNDMTSIDLSNNVNLVQVRLQTNNLSTLDLTGLDALTSLDAFSNGMSSITLPNSSSLETVNINNNGLSVLDVSGNSGLLTLSVTGNLLPTSELDNLVNTLDSFNTSDGVLNISGNTGALSSASAASYVNLESRNWTIDIPPATAGTTIVIETTSTLSSWTPSRITNSGATLRWEVTGGVTIPEQTVNLPTFDLSGNTGTAIITATSDDGFAGLTEVDVRGLDITAMDVTNAAALTRLIAFGNDMTSIDLSNNVNLVQVRLQTNNLSTLDLTGLDALTSLDAFSNGMSSITLPNSSSLETVNINNNGLSVLDVSGNSGLLTLSVTGNLLPTSELDNLVNTLDSFNTSDGVLSISGNTGSLSASSFVSYTNMVGRNWTFDVLPPTPPSGPQINIVRSDLNVPISNGNTPDLGNGTDFGQVGIGSPVTETFEVQNVGDSDLTIFFFFTSGVDFSFTPPGGGGIVIGSGQSTTIDVTFDPTALISRSGSITINSNTTEIADQSYVVNLAGEGIVAPTPEVITVLGNGISIPNGASTPEVSNGTDFENIEVGQNGINTFVIQNDGTDDLTVSSIGFTAVGSDPEFSIGTISETLPFDIVPGGQITFEVVFTPSGFTDYDAVVSINNSDLEENPFEYVVAGVGTEPVITGDIMISQYYHGFSGVDNWVEVTNISSSVIPADTYNLVLFDETLARQGVIETAVPTASTSIPELAVGETVLFKNSSAGVPGAGNIGSSVQINSNVCTFTGDDVVLISTSNDVTAYNLRVDIMGNISPNPSTSPQPWGTNDAYIKGGCSTEIAHRDFDINDWLFVEIESVDNADPTTNLALGTQVVGPTLFDGSTWSNLEPDQSRTAIIATSFTGAPDNFIACNLTINTGVNAVFDSNGATSNSVVIYGDLIVNGSLTIGDTESLVVYNPTASLGSITKLENSTPHNFANDLTYWSSPVQGSQLSTIFAGSDPSRIFEFRAGQVNPDYAGTNFQYWFVASGAMEQGRGYAVEGVGTGVQSIVFNGVPYNGAWSRNLYFSGSLDATPTANENFNLIGNPYPAAIDMQRILIDNGNVNEIALWTHATERDPSTGEFFDSDYVYYSTTGSTTPGVTENIASGQGFMIRTVSGGAITLIDDYKLIGRNDQFFKTSNQKSLKESPITENKLWLRMNLGREKNDILIAFLDGATDEYDLDYDVTGNLYDSKISLIDKKTKFYSKIDNNKFVIQGMGAFDGGRKVALGFDTKKEGDFRISLTKTLGALEAAEIYLIDHELNVRHDLKRSDYVFYQTELGEFSNRFTLELNDSNALLDVDELVDRNLFSISNDFDVMNVNSGKVVKEIKVYDMLGRMVIHKVPNLKSFQLNTSTVRTGTVMIIEARLEDGSLMNTKSIKY